MEATRTDGKPATASPELDALFAKVKASLPGLIALQQNAADITATELAVRQTEDGLSWTVAVERGAWFATGEGLDVLAAVRRAVRLLKQAEKAAP